MEDNSIDKEKIENQDSLANAIYKFNLNPSLGIYSLCEYYNVKPIPHLIAHILGGLEGLSEAKVTKYLTDPGNEEILDCYFRSLDLCRELVTAMRLCFSGALLMPADSQRIDCAINSMARVYFEQNKGAFHSVEECYSLVYSIIMLNSDINNPKNPRPMTMQQFISNSRELISTSLMSDDELKRVYNEIKTNPFTFKTEHAGNFMELCAPSCKGKLTKRTDNWKSFWAEHFFVLANSCLFYFKSDDPKYKEKPLGSIGLVGVTVKKNQGTFCIAIENQRNLQYMKFKNNRPYPVFGIKRIFLKAANEKEYNKWLYRIQASTTLKAQNSSPALDKSDEPIPVKNDPIRINSTDTIGKSMSVSNIMAMPETVGPELRKMIPEYSDSYSVDDDELDEKVSTLDDMPQLEKE